MIVLLDKYEGISCFPSQYFFVLWKRIQLIFWNCLWERVFVDSGNTIAKI